jgi:Domain of unknown function (DUF2703)
MENSMSTKDEKLSIQLLYLDLSLCNRCRDADAHLEQALAQVTGLLEATGRQVEVTKIHVTSENQAQALGFEVSPTIRVNGQDIQLYWKESPCRDCGELAGCAEDIACRVWVWKGEEYLAPPVPMLVDAILRTVYAGEGPAPVRPAAAVNANLKRFFAGVEAARSGADKACCGPTCCS